MLTPHLVGIEKQKKKKNRACFQGSNRGKVVGLWTRGMGDQGEEDELRE